MKRVGKHLQNKMVAGLLAAIPLVILLYGFFWIEGHTQPLLESSLKEHYVYIPGLPIVLALVAVYLLGLVVTSFAGKFFLRLLDSLLEHLPGFRLVYTAWKEVVLLPEGKASTFNQVVLVPQGPDQVFALGFTSAESLPGDPALWCVFLPNVPNPLTGRLVIVPREKCLLLKVPVIDVFKAMLSTGNYMPSDLRGSAPAQIPK
jgi:uncharacterized membrane protein